MGLDWVWNLVLVGIEKCRQALDWISNDYWLGFVPSFPPHLAHSGCVPCFKSLTVLFCNTHFAPFGRTARSVWLIKCPIFKKGESLDLRLSSWRLWTLSRLAQTFFDSWAASTLLCRVNWKRRCRLSRVGRPLRQPARLTSGSWFCSDQSRSCAPHVPCRQPDTD